MKTKVFLVSAPYDIPHTGDSDYVESITELLNETENIKAEFLRVPPLNKYRLFKSSKKNFFSAETPENEKTLKERLEKTCELRNKMGSYRDSMLEVEEKKKKKKRYDLGGTLEETRRLFNEDIGRKNAIEKFIFKKIEEALSDKDFENVVLNLQIRIPDTGIFFTPEDIDVLKKRIGTLAEKELKAGKKIGNFKMMITCHEYRINNNRRHLQAWAQNYFERADHVIFFNSQDKQSASHHADYSFIETPEKEPLKTQTPAEKKTKKAEENKYIDPEHEAPIPTDIIPKKSEKYAFTHKKDDDFWKKTSLSRVIIPHSKNPEFNMSPNDTSDIKKIFKRDANILTFGMIRSEKGFEASLDIAKALQEDKEKNHENYPDLKNSRVIMAGYPKEAALLSYIITETFKLKITEKIEEKIKKKEILLRLISKLLEAKEEEEEEEEEEVEVEVEVEKEEKEKKKKKKKKKKEETAPNKLVRFFKREISLISNLGEEEIGEFIKHISYIKYAEDMKDLTAGLYTKEKGRGHNEENEKENLRKLIKRLIKQPKDVKYKQHLENFYSNAKDIKENKYKKSGGIIREILILLTNIEKTKTKEEKGASKPYTIKLNKEITEEKKPVDKFLNILFPKDTKGKKQEPERDEKKKKKKKKKNIKIKFISIFKKNKELLKKLKKEDIAIIVKRIYKNFDACEFDIGKLLANKKGEIILDKNFFEHQGEIIKNPDYKDLVSEARKDYDNGQEAKKIIEGILLQVVGTSKEKETTFHKIIRGLTETKDGLFEYIKKNKTLFFELDKKDIGKIVPTILNKYEKNDKDLTKIANATASLKEKILKDNIGITMSGAAAPSSELLKKFNEKGLTFVLDKEKYEGKERGEKNISSIIELIIMLTEIGNERNARKILNKHIGQSTRNILHISSLHNLEGIKYLKNILKEHESLDDKILPLDILIDISKSDLKNLFKKTKYAVKYDGKGMANNASGHISSFTNGCILFTSWGINTDEDVLKKRKLSLGVLGEKYFDAPGGKYHHAIEFLGRGECCMKLVRDNKGGLIQNVRLVNNYKEMKKSFTTKEEREDSPPKDTPIKDRVPIKHKDVLKRLNGREKQIKDTDIAQEKTDNWITLCEAKKLYIEKFSGKAIKENMKIIINNVCKKEEEIPSTKPRLYNAT